MKAVVTGAGGFIGGHLAARLAADANPGDRIVGIDIKPHEEWWQRPVRTLTMRRDLRISDPSVVRAMEGADECYHLACDMGGRGWIDSQEEACAMNAMLDLQVIKAARDAGVKRVFYASTACVYHEAYQGWEERAVFSLREEMIEAMGGFRPDGMYGLAKLYGEKSCAAFTDLDTRIGRFHGVFGPHGSWNDGREKAPAALMRKVATQVMQRRRGDGSAAPDIEVWGDGKQTRSFMHVDDAVEGMIRLMRSDVKAPVNLGSEETVTMDEMVRTIAGIAGLDNLSIRHVEGPVGVTARTSDNTLIRQVLGWAPSISLEEGIRRTYPWIAEQVEAAHS